MKKFALFLSAAMAMSLAGCGNSSASASTAAASAAASSDSAASASAEGAASGDVTRIALVLPYIGDQSYFDTAYNGLSLLTDKYGSAVETNLIEMGTDAGGWDTAYRQAADSDYDIIISGNFEYEPYMLEVAKEYPDIKFLNFDYSDAALNSLDNVYAITYAANEAGYAAGVVAATVSESGIIGCIGGMEVDGIKQFLAGYMQGAYDVNPDIKVISSFVGDFSDTAKAKEIASNMHSQGADVIYHAAGGAGNGLFEAAAEEDFWAIGVDSDQYMSFKDNQPELAAHILTSSEKKCDQGILSAVTEMIDGTAAYGTQKTLGIKDGGIGLAENENYEANTTEEQRAAIQAQIDKVVSGEVTDNDQLKDNTSYDTWLEKTALN